MSKETFLEKSRTPYWDHKVNLPDGGQGLFVQFEREIEHIYSKEAGKYDRVIDLKPKGSYAVVKIEPFGNKVNIPIDQFFEVN